MDRLVNDSITEKGGYPIYDEHRDDRPPIGQVTRCWIGPLPGHPGEHGLQCELEIEDGKVSDHGALSIAFFGPGHVRGNSPEALENPDIVVGYSPGSLSAAEVMRLLTFLHEQLPVRAAAVKEFREHSLDAVASGVWIILLSDYANGGLTKTLVDALIDQITAALYQAGGPKARVLKIRLKSDDLTVQVPMDFDPSVAKVALREAFRTARERGRRPAK